MIVKRYEKAVLNQLMDKYEKSPLYTGKNRRRQTIGFVFNPRSMPEYFDETSREYEVIHAQLQELEQKGYIALVWKNGKPGHILEKCVLCPDKADEAYAYLGRSSRKKREEAVLRVCGRYGGKDPLLDRFLNWVRVQIDAGGTLHRYGNGQDPEWLESFCSMLLAILQNQEESFWREFSVRFFHDTKTAEKELSGAAQVIRDFTLDLSLKELEAQQVLEEFRIYKTPSWVMMKGCGSFRIRGETGGCAEAGGYSQPVRLSQIPWGIGISSRDISGILWEREEGLKRVITIENLTSFHRWREQGSLAIYLGGYHNEGKRAFLKKLYAFCSSQAVFEHFGDLDCGGFQIWKDLCQKTGIPFQTRLMDQKTYLSFLEYGKELTANDRERLKRMMEDPFFAAQKSLFASMLETGKKLEQECIRGVKENNLTQK